MTERVYQTEEGSSCVRMTCQAETPVGMPELKSPSSSPTCS